MPKKKKEQINPEAIDLKIISEEAVGCSRLGRTLASFGATLTGREKHNAELIYHSLRAERIPPTETPVTISLAEDIKEKKYGYVEAVKWFVSKYPKEAQPLLNKLNETYDKKERSVCYGLREGQDLADDYYIKVLVDMLDIPRQDAAVMYHGSIKPHLERMREKEGLVKLVMEK